MPLLLLFSFLSLFSPTQSSSPRLPIWPYPTAVSWPSPSAAPLSPSFQILSPSSPRHLRIATRHYNRLLLSELHRPLAPLRIPLSSPSLNQLHISITDPTAPLHHGVDESYALYIPSSGAHANLTAHTPWGAIRGLETLSQLVWAEGTSSKPRVVATGVYIYDRPLFPHRGLLLDTARNYYPVKDVLRTVRAMGHNKMNVFHWHITDSQSFPIELPSEPRLAAEGAYGEGMKYSVRDVRRVVDYAMSFGIRVIPEIDAPGHTASWAGAYPDLVTCTGMFWLPPGSPALSAEPDPGQLNPLNPKTYKVLHNVYRDVAALFPDPFYHVGVDEVTPACWEQDPAIRAFISNNGTLDQILEIFVNTTHPYIVSLNRTALYWEDVILSSTVKVNPSLLPKETTVFQTWNNGPNNTKQLMAAGYRVIVSSADFYYLDCGHGGWLGNDSRYDRQESDIPGKPFNYAGGNGGSWCAPFKTWQRVYDYDITYGLTDVEAQLVLGGEVALWSEQSDETVVDGRLWPRAAAAAEAWWSGNRNKDGKKRYAEATDRIDEWRHRMVGRKIGAEPIQPLWCSKNPGMCNLVQ